MQHNHHSKPSSLYCFVQRMHSEIMLEVLAVNLRQAGQNILNKGCYWSSPERATVFCFQKLYASTFIYACAKLLPGVDGGLRVLVIMFTDTSVSFSELLKKVKLFGTSNALIFSLHHAFRVLGQQRTPEQR